MESALIQDADLNLVLLALYFGSTDGHHIATQIRALTDTIHEHTQTRTRMWYGI